MPHLSTCSLPDAYGRVPSAPPATPLAAGDPPLMERVEIAPGLSFSRLVYGMWRLGDDPDISAGHVRAKLEACLDQGITTMDQADIYGGYMAEEILGRALAGTDLARPDRDRHQMRHRGPDGPPCRRAGQALRHLATRISRPASISRCD